MAGAVGPLATGPHHNPHEPFLGDPSLYRDHAAAVVDDHSIGNLHAIAKGGGTSSAVADEENAPVAIISGTRKGSTRNAGAS
jgi:hypothetical protein